MEQETRIEEYLGQLAEITEKVGDQQVAVRVLREIAKDRRAAMISAERNGNGNHSHGTQKRVFDVNAPATAAQIGMIKRLGGKPSPGMSKGAASEMIDLLMNGH